VLYSGGLFAQVITTLIRCNDSESILCKKFYLILPATPDVWETMQEEHESPIRGA
jgi:hypothetical protein